MKIRVAEKAMEEVGNLKPGDCFVFGGIPYMKVSMRETPVEEGGIPVSYLVDLMSGVVLAWDLHTSVAPVDATMEIS